MDITKFIATQREQNLLNGDYELYTRWLGRRVLRTRRRLRFTTSPIQKKLPKRVVGVDDVAKDHEFVHLLLLISERAWAQALHMKAAQTMESSNQGLATSTRRQIISRLNRAIATSDHLIKLLEQQKPEISVDGLIQAWIYHLSLLEAIAFERSRWQDCIETYALAHRLYESPVQSCGAKKDASAWQILEFHAQPCLRYAAYQLKVPRTTSIEALVEQNFDHKLQYVNQITLKVPMALKQTTESIHTTRDHDSQKVPKSLQWRSRTVMLEDASTAQALALVAAAETKLRETLEAKPRSSPRDKAAAYQDILNAAQDAVDAVKTALSELSSEGLLHSDPRLQALQITRTAATYSLIKWRIGRNRVLCGDADGLYLDGPQRNGERHTDYPKTEVVNSVAQLQSKGSTLKYLKECLVLYDATIQSLEMIESLPGVAADVAFLDEVKAIQSYFYSLRYLAIARSHSLGSQLLSGLALLLDAKRCCRNASVGADKPDTPVENSPLNIHVSKSRIDNLGSILQTLIIQHWGLVELSNVSLRSTSPASALDLLRSLKTYPTQEVSLENLVGYPPEIEPVPVKPIFLDIAYNYLQYPEDGTSRQHTKSTDGVLDRTNEGNLAKKGWFGFGR